MGRYDSELGTCLLVCNNIMLVNGLLWSFVLQSAKEFWKSPTRILKMEEQNRQCDCQCEPF